MYIVITFGDFGKRVGDVVYLKSLRVDTLELNTVIDYGRLVPWAEGLFVELNIKNWFGSSSVMG